MTECLPCFVATAHLLIVTGERLGHNDPVRAGAGSESDHDRSSERSDDLSSRESLAEQVNMRAARPSETDGVTCRIRPAISVIR